MPRTGRRSTSPAPTTGRERSRSPASTISANNQSVLRALEDVPSLARRGIDRAVVSRFLRLAAPFWGRTGSPLAKAGLVAYSLFIVAGAGLFGWLTFLDRAQLNDLNARHESAYYTTLAVLTVANFLRSGVDVLVAYLIGRLQLAWRTALTLGSSARYLASRRYYEIERDRVLDNPDERIAEDTSLFVTSSAFLYASVLASIASLAVSIPITWSIVGPWITLVLAVYSLAGSIVFAKAFGRLSHVNAQQLKVEADYRFGLIRIREYAEAIAFYRGEARESQTLWLYLRRALEIAVRVLTLNFGFNMAQSVWGTVLMVAPLAIVASSYFAHRIDLGATSQIALTVTGIVATFSTFVNDFPQWARWSAQVDRLSDLERTVGERPRSLDRAIRSERRDGAVVISGVTVAQPEADRVLVEDLSVEVAPGDALVLYGPTGSGKSSLLRVLAGLWPAHCGAIELPPAARVAFLPQRPYLPIGDLRIQIAYPNDPPIDCEAEYAAYLEAVGLSDLVSRFGFEERRDWEHVLSLGEQQLLAVARVLAAKPSVVFVDEGTASLSPAAERRVDELLRALGGTVISVSHGPGGDARRLEIGLPGGAWALSGSAP